MSNFSLLTATQVVEKTMAYTFYRQIVWIGICFAYLLAVLIGTGTALALNAIGIKFSGLASLGGLAGFCICGYFLYQARKAVFLPLRTGHAAVIAEALKGESFPAGREQIGYAKALVQKRFKDEARLFELDNKIKEVLRALVQDRFGIAKPLPFPGGERASVVINAAIGHSLGFLDELILAYHLQRGEENPYASARDGLVLLAQNHRSLLKTALILFVLIYTGLFAVFYLFLVPAGWVTDLFPVPVDLWGWVFAMVFAWSIKATFFESITLAVLVQVFSKTVEKQQPSAEWESRLRELSARFGEIADANGV